MIGSLGAILLAGGRGSRLGGVDKPLLAVGASTLLERAVAAASDLGARPVTIAGDPSPLEADVTWVREDPSFSGPAAATVAALASWQDDPDWTLVLPCDMPRASDAAAQLVRDAALLPAHAEGIVFADESGRPQWLPGVYRTIALRKASAEVPDAGRDQSMRTLLSGLSLAAVRAEGGVAADIDTWEDLERARDEEER